MITGRDNHTLQAKTGRLNHALEQTAHVPDILDIMTRFSIAIKTVKKLYNIPTSQNPPF